MGQDEDSRSPEEITELLRAWGRGDQAAFDQLASIVYAELRSLARHYMTLERPDHTLQPTALVHEAYMRLANFRTLRWQNRIQFFAISSRVMRRVLVDSARARERRKRGGTSRRLSLEVCGSIGTKHDAALLALDDALNALAVKNSRKCQVVEMKFFGGLSADEIAHSLNVSPDTVLRDWKLARLWLLREMAAKEKEG